MNYIVNFQIWTQSLPLLFCFSFHVICVHTFRLIWIHMLYNICYIFFVLRMVPKLDDLSIFSDIPPIRDFGVFWHVQYISINIVLYFSFSVRSPFFRVYLFVINFFTSTFLHQFLNFGLKIGVKKQNFWLRKQKY